MSRTIRLLTLALVSGALLAPAVAQASPGQTSIMMDDDLLLYRSDTVAVNALTQMKRLGVDTARVTVLWRTVAENARPTAAEIKKLRGGAKSRAQLQARRFRATNPKTYPRRNWDRYDNLVTSAARLGIRIYFNVTGPGPTFGHEKFPKNLRGVPSNVRAAWKPRPAAFKQFVQAVGRRYDGSYRDENGSRAILPRVKFWSLWNEPNQGGWLAPQWERRGSSIVPVAAALYRKLHQNGYRALVSTGHRVDNDTILMGETAPLGMDLRTAKAPMRPAQFMREVACVQANGVRYTGNAARLRDCGDFARGPLIANGFAHHPYTRNIPPTVRDANRDAITMANINDLGALLDDLSSKTGGSIPNNLPLFMTEFGFETKPPDPFNGIDLLNQPVFNNIGEWQAWQNPRILSQAQFLLRDVDPVRKHPRSSKAYWFTYQSGLFFRNGVAKPAAAAYAMPFLAFNSRALDPVTGTSVFNLWGQLRFLPNGTNAAAAIQWRAKDGGGAWATVGDLVPIDALGYFTAARTAPSPALGEWRSAVVDPNGAVVYSSPGTTGF